MHHFQPAGGSTLGISYSFRGPRWVPRAQSSTSSTQFADQAGLSLLHCHNLGHEDMAMMADSRTVLDTMARGKTNATGGPWVVAARWVGISAVFVNLGIHLALAPDHLSEMPYIGVLFTIASGALALVVIALASDRDSLRTVGWLVGSVVCVVEFIAFMISRTVGLPLGYHEGWTGATEDVLGLASLFLELVFIGCAVLSLSRQPRFAAVQVPRWWMLLHDRTAPLP